MFIPLLMFCVAIQWLGVQSEAFQVKKPNMTKLVGECLTLGRDELPESPLTFQLEGFCLWFTCNVTAVKNGLQASVTTKGCGPVSAKQPCHIRDYDLTLPFPACCPRAVCPQAPPPARRLNSPLAAPETPNSVTAALYDQQSQVLALQQQLQDLKRKYQQLQQQQRQQYNPSSAFTQMSHSSNYISEPDSRYTKLLSRHDSSPLPAHVSNLYPRRRVDEYNAKSDEEPRTPPPANRNRAAYPIDF